jgi:hypothetical protein
VCVALGSLKNLLEPVEERFQAQEYNIETPQIATARSSIKGYPIILIAGLSNLDVVAELHEM